MHPGIYAKWKRARQEFREQRAGACGHHGSNRGGEDGPSYQASGGFGVRRPLRVMAHKLELEEDQVKELAAILNDIKMERAQASVDEQRSVSAIADALAGENFDQTKVQEALAQRVKSAERLRDEVLKTLKRTHALLNPEQRDKLAYLLRSGGLTI